MTPRKATNAAVLDAPDAAAKPTKRISGARTARAKKPATDVPTPVTKDEPETETTETETEVKVEPTGTGWPVTEEVKQETTTINLITVDPGDLIIGIEVRDLLMDGGASRFYKDEAAFQNYGFPRPVLTLRSGPVFSRKAIIAWDEGRKASNQERLAKELRRTEERLALLRQRVGVADA